MGERELSHIASGSVNKTTLAQASAESSQAGHAQLVIQQCLLLEHSTNVKIWRQNMDINVHSRFFHNSQKLETIQTSIKSRKHFYKYEIFKRETITKRKRKYDYLQLMGKSLRYLGNAN